MLQMGGASWACRYRQLNKTLSPQKYRLGHLTPKCLWAKALATYDSNMLSHHHQANSNYTSSTLFSILITKGILFLMISLVVTLSSNFHNYATSLLALHLTLLNPCLVRVYMRQKEKIA